MSESVVPVLWHELNSIQEELLAYLLAHDYEYSLNTLLSIKDYQDPEDSPHPWTLAQAELQEMGYLYGLNVSTRGLAYFQQKDDREKAAADLRAKEERIRDEDRKREWALTHVTGAYGLIGIFVGLIIGYLLGVK